MDLIPGLRRVLGEGNSNPVRGAGEFQEQRSLVGYSPWGRKESDTAEHTPEKCKKDPALSLYSLDSTGGASDEEPPCQ